MRICFGLWAICLSLTLLENKICLGDSKNGIEEKEEKFRDSYSSGYFASDANNRYIMTKKKIRRGTGHKRTCIVEIKLSGKGISDRFEVPCSMRGGVTDMTENTMSFGTPGQSSLCLYSETPATLVIFKQNTCTKKTYGVIPSETPMSTDECEKVKEKIRKCLGTNGKINFGDGIDSEETQDLTSNTPDDTVEPPAHETQTATEYSRKGSWWTTRSSRVSFRVEKASRETGQCGMYVVGRGVNDYIEGRCELMEGNMKRATKNNKVVIANSSKGFSVLLNNNNELFVYKNGRCTKRGYETSFFTGNTKVTCTPINEQECANVLKSINSVLGV